MSREKFSQARELIQQKKYDQARKVLRGVNHPQAKQWLEKIDELDPPQADNAGIGQLLLIAGMILLAIMLGAGGFLAGRMTVKQVDKDAFATDVVNTVVAEIGIFSTDTPAEIATESAPIILPSPEPSAAFTPSPTIDANGLGAASNPIPAGQTIENAGGNLRILQVHNPTAYGVYDLDSLSDSAILPVQGTEFAGVEFEFTCPTTEITCRSVPYTDIALVLSDGRIAPVEQDYYSVEVTNLEFDEISGGRATTGWAFFVVPERVPIASIRLTDYSDSEVFAALPPIKDGFAIEYEWVSSESGTLFRIVPRLHRELLELGYEVTFISEIQSNGEIYLGLNVYTGDTLFFEESEVVASGRDIVLDILKLRDFDVEIADVLLVNIENSAGSIIGSIIIRRDDIRAFQKEAASIAAFANTWDVTVGD